MGDKRLRMKGLPYKWKALLTVALGVAMATMDASIITIAFPELTRVFHADLATVMWIAVVYILVSSSLMLVFGKLSDTVGRKRIYTVGLGIFTIGMAACGLARSIDQMIIFRIVQAVGAAMSIGCSMAIVTEAFPGEDMGRGLGMLGISVSIGFIVGPVAGGFLLDRLGWPAIFYTRIPLVILAIALAVILLREDVRREKKANLDIWGVVASFAGLFSLLFGMGQIKARGLTSPMVIMLVGAGLFILCLLPLIERHAKEPLINFALLKDRAFTCSMAGLFIFFLTMPVYIAIMPFYLLTAIGLSATGSGLLLSAIPIATMIASPISGALSDRFGARWPSVLGGSGCCRRTYLHVTVQSEHGNMDDRFSPGFARRRLRGIPATQQQHDHERGEAGRLWVRVGPDRNKPPGGPLNRNGPDRGRLFSQTDNLSRSLPAPGVRCGRGAQAFNPAGLH